MRSAARSAQCCDRRFQAIRVIVDADDDRTFARHDLGGRPADTVCECGNDRDLVGEPHGCPLFSQLLPMHAADRPARENGQCNRVFICRMPANRPHRRRSAVPRCGPRISASTMSGVSEHIIVPRATFPRSPLFYDPVLSLTWAAAVTKRVRLGTSVLVLPLRHPLPLAKELATL